MRTIPYDLARDSRRRSVIAALFVQPRGAYAGLPGVDPWDEARDARTYAGPHPVVAHPPCARWGAYATGGPRHPGSKIRGDDGGCFAAAIESVRRWGGVLEHPRGSSAWPAHGLAKPPPGGGWVRADRYGWTCCVEQGHYGHPARKATWLYYVGAEPPSELVWGSSQTPDPPDCPWSGSEVRSFSKPPKGAGPDFRAQRRAWLAWRKAGGCKVYASPELLSRGQREATPIPFRDLLIDLAQLSTP
jgi:hypothetical protein